MVRALRNTPRVRQSMPPFSNRKQAGEPRGRSTAELALGRGSPQVKGACQAARAAGSMCRAPFARGKPFRPTLAQRNSPRVGLGWGKEEPGSRPRSAVPTNLGEEPFFCSRRMNVRALPASLQGQPGGNRPSHHPLSGEWGGGPAGRAPAPSPCPPVAHLLGGGRCPSAGPRLPASPAAQLLPEGKALPGASARAALRSLSQASSPPARARVLFALRDGHGSSCFLSLSPARGSYGFPLAEVRPVKLCSAW